MNLIIKHFPELSDLQIQQFKALQPLIYIDNEVEIKISNKKYKIIKTFEEFY